MLLSVLIIRGRLKITTFVLPVSFPGFDSLLLVLPELSVSCGLLLNLSEALNRLTPRPVKPLSWSMALLPFLVLVSVCWKTQLGKTELLTTRLNNFLLSKDGACFLLLPAS